MSEKPYDLVITGADLASHTGCAATHIAIKDGRFAKIGDVTAEQSAAHIDAKGLTLLPGVIDTQVHFREPGNEHKEDLQSGSLAAVMGGVTAVFEMPNTKPPTTSVEAIADKVARGRNRMHCDFAFYAGGTHENAALLPELERQEGVCGVKVFMGSSTGNLLVADDDGVADILKHITRRAAFHSEDEFRLRERRRDDEKKRRAVRRVRRGDQSGHRGYRKRNRKAQLTDKRVDGRR